MNSTGNIISDFESDSNDSSKNVLDCDGSNHSTPSHHLTSGLCNQTQEIYSMPELDLWNITDFEFVTNERSNTLSPLPSLGLSTEVTNAALDSSLENYVEYTLNAIDYQKVQEEKCNTDTSEPLQSLNPENVGKVQNIDSIPISDLDYGTYIFRVSPNGSQKEYMCHPLKNMSISDIISISSSVLANNINQDQQAIKEPTASQGRYSPYNVRNSKTGRKINKLRTIFTENQKDKLEEAYSEQKYIGFTKANKLSASLNLDYRIVQVWFKNRRAKDGIKTKQ